MLKIGILSLLLAVSFVASQETSPPGQINETRCVDYIQYFCSIRTDCPQPRQDSTPIMNVNGNSIDLRDFNAVSFNNFLARTGDVQGRVACAGNFVAGNGFSIGDQLEAQSTNISSASYPYGLIVGGSAIWGSGRMYAEGIFVAGRTEGDVLEQTASLDSCNDASQDCLDSEFSSARSYFVEVSQYFANQQENTRHSIQFSTLEITCNASNSVYVVNLTPSELSYITSYRVSPNCSENALWLFNVVGSDSVTFRGDFFRQPAISVLWNIIGDERIVNIFTEVRGNILATQSTFTQPGGVVDGNVIAGNMLVLQINTLRCLPIGGGVVPPIASPPASTNQSEGEFCPFWEKNCTGYDFSLNSSRISFKNYHVISFGNFVANTGDIEGRLAVRNNLVLGCGYSVGFQLHTGGENATDVPEDYSIIVGNSARWCSGALFPDGSGSPFEGNRENMFVGGEFTSPAYLQLRKSAASCSNCLESAFSSARACYTNVSNNYGNLNSNVNVSSEFSTLNLTCNSPNATQYIAFVTGEQINQTTSWAVNNCNNTAFFIINVVGNDSITFTGGSIPLPSSNVLYNILGCGRVINVNTGVNGAILAPYNILNQTGGVITGKVVIGDVLFALQINIVRCPLNLQDNTTAPVNETASGGASTMVTTGAGAQTGVGGIIGSPSEGSNTTGGQGEMGGFGVCPVLSIGSSMGNNTEVPTDVVTDTFGTEIPSRIFGTQDIPIHNSGTKVQAFAAVAYLVAFLF